MSGSHGPIALGWRPRQAVTFYADLHVHSKYSRATSRDCDLEHLSWWAQRKGVSVVATGDFTHPGWLEELQSRLVAAEPGLFRLKPEIERDIAERLPKSCRREPTRFMLSVEISTIYKKAGRTRKIHHLVYAPDFETVARCRRALGKIGNLNSDGRPILGLDSRHLLEIIYKAAKARTLCQPTFGRLGLRRSGPNRASIPSTIAMRISHRTFLPSRRAFHRTPP